MLPAEGPISISCSNPSIEYFQFSLSDPLGFEYLSTRTVSLKKAFYQVRLDMEMSDFTPSWFINEVATSLEIDPLNIEVIDYFEGSVIVQYNLQESPMNDHQIEDI